MKLFKKLISFTPGKVSFFITLFMLCYYGINKFNENSTFIDNMDNQWIDLTMRNREQPKRTNLVGVAAIDSQSIDKFGRWPWSRKVMADVLTTLNDHYEVSVIGFDMVFSEPVDAKLKLANQFKKKFEKLNGDKSKEGKAFLNYISQTQKVLDGDQALGNVYKKYDNIISGYYFQSGDIDYIPYELREESSDRVLGSSIGIVSGYRELLQNKQQANIPSAEFPELDTKKISPIDSNYGTFNVRIDKDGVVRRIHSIWESKGKFYPALVLKMLERHYKTNIQLTGFNLGIEEIKIGTRVFKPHIDGSFLINYKGKTQTFPHYSVKDIYEKTIPKNKLKGKILFVGVTETGLHDLRTTPVGEADPGVEVHVNLMDNLLTNTYFRVDGTNQIYTFFLIMGMGLLLGLWLPRLKLFMVVVTVSVLVFGYYLFHTYCVNVVMSFPSFWYVILTILFNAFGILGYMFFVSDKDKRYIKGAFQQYLSPDVIETLMDDPDALKLGGEERVMTALFSDIQGFSTISEKLTPNELVALLNDYLTAMSNVIMKYGGTVDKFEGDAIIAFFGAPIAYEDHAARAAKVCLEMDAILAEKRIKAREEGSLELFQRIGINSGPMVVGNMGSLTRFDYTIMGNTVNLAARLEGANKLYKNSLLMSEMTYKMCNTEIIGRELDSLRVVGINKPVRVYDIVCQVGELDPLRENAFKTFAEGLELYRAKKFAGSLKAFNAVLKKLPTDGPSLAYVERCNNFIASPPPEDWDGVYSATSK